MKVLMNMLEEATNCKLEIFTLLDFLKKVCSEVPSSSKGYLVNWHLYNEYEPLMTKTKLVHCEGCWIPKVCSNAELIKQTPWKDFLLNYDDKSKIRKGYDNKDFQPLNFNELVNSTAFWPSLYEFLGHKVVKFIFERCLLIFQIEQEVFLLITSYKSSLNFNIQSESTKSNFRGRKPIVHHVSKQTNQGEISGSIESAAVQVTLEPRGIKRKPTVSSLSVDPFNDGVGGKRLRHTEQNSHESVGRGATSSTDRDRNEMVIPHIAIQHKGNTENSLEDHIVRWITPKSEILNQIIIDRDALKQTLSVRSSTNSSKSNTTYSFVEILRDYYFTQNDIPFNYIGKKTVTAPYRKLVSSLPKEFSGLKISEKLKSDTEYTIIAYTLSESQAKHYKIRIKPRLRQRKSTTVVDKTKQPLCNLNPEIAAGSGQINNVNLKRSLKSLQDLQPDIPLPTLSILYNGGGWTRPSGKHFTQKITSLSKENGVKLLVSEMLNSVVIRGAPKSKDFIKKDAMLDLEKILTGMVSFHKKVKDIHKLVKTCLNHWVIKEKTRTTERESKRLQRHDFARKRKLRNTIMEIPQNDQIRISERSISLDKYLNTTNQNCVSMLTKSDTSQKSNSNIPYNLKHLSQFFPSETSDRSFRSKLSLTPKSLLEGHDKRKLARYNVKQTVSHSCVLSTLRQVMHLSKANTLLGSSKNIKKFFSFVKKSIMLGGLRSSFQLVQLVSQLNPQDCSWLKNIEDSDSVTYIFSSVVQWLYNNYILIMLRTSFYVTEVASGRNKIEFYLKENWKSLSEKLKNEYIRNNILNRTSQEADQTKLRLLPKQHNKIRPIMSISNTADMLDRRMYSCDCNTLLNYMISKMSPASLIGVDAIRNKWSDFIKSQTKDKRPTLFYVRADIKDAYASIDVNLLKKIMRNIVQESGNLVRKSYRVITMRLRGPNFRSVSSLLDENNRQNWHSSISSRPCIIQEYTDFGVMDVRIVIDHITRVLRNNIVRMGKCNYKFNYGLPQGWVRSQQLCSIYYGHMEKTHFAEYLNKPSELFLRSVDDYFYVSTNARRIFEFSERMRKGVAEYNCTMQETKFSTNLHVSSRRDGIDCSSFSEWIKFCGWQFCLATGHTGRDLSSYAGQDICQTLSFRLTGRNADPDRFLINRMGFIRPLRLSFLLVDPSMNCKRQIIANIYDAALMSAFRFYAICRVIYPSSNTFFDGSQILTFLKAIRRTARVLVSYVRRCNIYVDPSKQVNYPCTDPIKSCVTVSPTVRKRLKSLNSKSDSSQNNIIVNSSNESQLPSDTEVNFLIYHAFIVKLNLHGQAFSKGLIPKLKKFRGTLRKRLSDMEYKFLLETVDLKLPKRFAVMKK